MPVAHRAALLLALLGCGDNRLPVAPDAPLPLPACSDGVDNDSDGLTDFPVDPGCASAAGDAELDDCPSGPACPQCGNGVDDDQNTATDFPADSGCTSASDPVEFAADPMACGAGLVIEPLPASRMVTARLDASSTSVLASTCGAGARPGIAYQLYLPSAKVIVASTEDPGTDANTVVDIRSSDCAAAAAAIACNDDAPGAAGGASRVSAMLAAGNYYIVVSARDIASAGPFTLRVLLYSGEGSPCATDVECGPGLICRAPPGGGALACQPPACSDRFDNDADGRTDYPFDPGCVSPDDDAEDDPCPGAGCPECGDGIDNDGDAATDYPADGTCDAASDISEACVTTEPTTAILTGTTAGTTLGAANDVQPSCASTVSHSAADRTYRIDLPATDVLELELVDLVPAFWDTVTALHGSTCGGAALACSDAPAMRVNGLPAGTYYYVVDGYSSAVGDFTIRLSGTVANGGSCEGALFAAGALACNTGYTCGGTAGQRTCRRAACDDGADNDVDSRSDFPADPGCASPSDDDETDPVTAPACANAADDDTDGLVDWPADYGCAAASGTSEVFCAAETDPTAVITAAVTTGSTTTATSQFASQSCQAAAAGGDVVFALPLPVAVETLVIDTDTSAFDTVLTVRDAQCEVEHGCDDDGGAMSQSRLTLSNVRAGNYAVIVDGFSGGPMASSGAFTLTIRGMVAPQTPCGSPLFAGGTDAVLSCPAGTTCSGTPAICQ